MKKAFLTVAIAVLSIFTAFAANSLPIERAVTDVNAPVFSLKKDLIVEHVKFETIEYAEFADCKMTIRKKNPDGTWDTYEITVHGTSCADLIKQIMQ